MDLSKLGITVTHRGDLDSVAWLPAIRLHRPSLATHVEVMLAKDYPAISPKDSDVEKITEDMAYRRIGIKLFERHGSEPHVMCTPISWREFMALRDLNGAVPKSEKFMALAVNCLVMTSDDLFIIAKRSDKVATHKGAWTASAMGYVDFAPNLELAVLESVKRELLEEVGVPTHTETSTIIRSIQPLGAWTHPMPQPLWFEIGYLAWTTLTGGSVIASSNDPKIAKDSWEGKQHAMTAGEVVDLLKTTPPELLHPPGVTCITLAFEKLGIKL